MKKILVFLLFAQASCQPDNEKYVNLLSTIDLLSQQINNLQKQVDTLSKSPKDLMQEMQVCQNAKDVKGAKALLTIFNERYPTTEQQNIFKKLSGQLVRLEEKQEYDQLTENFSELAFQIFKKRHPSSKFLPSLKTLFDRLHRKTPSLKVLNSNAPSSYNFQARPSQRISSSRSSSIRIGAWCCDGTRSYATGSGACSHHGGVCEWIYE